MPFQPLSYPFTQAEGGGTGGGRAGGFGRIPFVRPPSLNDEQRNWFLDPDEGLRRSYQAMINPYLQQFGNTSFSDYLLGRGWSDARSQYDTLASNYALGGGLENLPNFLDFFQNMFDPTQSYYSLRPQERGENPGAFSPFTRYLGGR